MNPGMILLSFHSKQNSVKAVEQARVVGAGGFQMNWTLGPVS